MPTPSSLLYEDRSLCYAVGVPAGRIANGQPGAFAWFTSNTERSQFNVANNTPGPRASLEMAAENTRGPTAPHVDDVSERTIGGRLALLYRLAPEAPGSYTFGAWVVAPDCYNGEHLLSISGWEAGEVEFEDFLNRLRFPGWPKPMPTPTAVVPPTYPMAK